MSVLACGNERLLSGMPREAQVCVFRDARKGRFEPVSSTLIDGTLLRPMFESTYGFIDGMFSQLCYHRTLAAMSVVSNPLLGIGNTVNNETPECGL